MIENRSLQENRLVLEELQNAELAELVDALDSGSSARKGFRVQVPGSASAQ